jgi:hypothetical protein
MENELRKPGGVKTFFVVFVVLYRSVYEQPPPYYSWFQRYGRSKTGQKSGRRAATGRVIFNLKKKNHLEVQLQNS